jgi:carboxypeptidase family protein
MQRLPHQRRVGLAAVVFLTLSLQALASFAPPAPEPGPDELLVGVLVGSHEIGALDVRLAQDGYLVPLEELAELIGCRLYGAATDLRLDTPLGPVRLEPADLREVDGKLYLPEAVVESKLATEVTFDRSRYALRFDLPWRTPDGETLADARPLEPDVNAPQASLSTLYADLRYTRFAEAESYRGATQLGGALAGGYWRMRYETDFEGQHHLRDYAWLYRGERDLFLAGNQRVRVHPLLRGLEFTGAQYARTNQSLDLFRSGPAPTELLSRQMQPISTFEGQGPPAGAAELWINGVIVERQAIGLDGRYAFVDVSIPARQASQVEVRLYDRHNLGVPVEIIEDVRTASAFLLPDGASVHMAGAGAGGNFLQDRITGYPEPRGGAGFYQTRHGVSDTLTLEAAVQGADEGGQGYGGFVARLSRKLVMSMALGGSSEQAFGYSVELEGLSRPWRLLGRAQSAESGFDPLYPYEQRDHYLEVGWTRGSRLDLALIGRSRRNASTSTDFLLPAAMVRPLPALWMGARPDIDGAYRYDVLYRLGPDTRGSIGSTKGRTFSELWHELRPDLRMTAAADIGGGLPDRYALLFTGYGSSRWHTTWTAGPLFTDGDPGYLLGGRVTLVPGIVGQARLESDALGTDSEYAGEPRLLLDIVADLGLARGRFVAASPYAVREGRGGIAGVVHVDAPPGFPKPDLADVPVSLDGRRVARTDAHGQFFIGALQPGVYQIELERDNLPIELVPRLARLNAQVGGAAVTRVDFIVRPEFGAAGRVVGPDGAPIAGLALELLDGARVVVERTVTDAFGLYRMDGLPVGSYLLRVAPGARGVSGEPASSRIVNIADDFVFGQDLVLATGDES